MKKLCFLLFVLVAVNASAITRSWTNTAGGSWFGAANWSPNGVPNEFDTANITSAGTYTVLIPTGAVTVAVLNLGAGSGTQTLLNGTSGNLFVTNSGSVTANGILTITNGGLQGFLTVQPGGQLQLAGAAVKNMYQLSLINQGTVTWSGGTLQGGSTPTTSINNSGLWEITGNNSFNQTFGGPLMTWTNSGTLRKSAGTGGTQLGAFVFANLPAGAVEALAGTLTLNSVTNVLGGSFTATTPAVLSFAAGTSLDAGGTASGTGTNQFSGGQLHLRTNTIPGLRHFGGEIFVTGTTTFQQAGAITNLLLEGSQLRGTNRVGNGALTVNSGGVDGQLTIQPGGQLALSGSAVKNLYSLFLINEGTVAWSGGTLQGGSTPSTVISNGGLWQITGNNSFGQTFGGPAMSWTNTGTLQKSGGGGTSALNSFNFVNRPFGTVTVSSGTLTFNGGTNEAGGSFVANAPGVMSIIGGIWTDAGGTASGSGTNQFAGGTFNLRTNPIPGLRLFGGEIYVTGTTTFQQGGAITNLLLEGSQLRGTNRVGAGALTVQAGGVDGQLTIATGGQMNLSGSSVKNLYSLFLINEGTVAWGGGTLQGGSTPPTVVSNGGLWQITSDNSFGQTFGGPAMTWTNTGILRKSAGIGSSSLSSFNFYNAPSCLVESLSGTLTLNGGNGVLGGMLNATAPAVVSIISGTWTDAGGAAFGTGTNQFAGGVLNYRTNIIPGLRHAGGDIYVTGTTTFQQTGAITNLTLDGSQLKGTNLIGNGTLTVNAGGVEGQLTVLPGGQLLLTNSPVKNLYALNLLNQGLVQWTAGTLQGGSTPPTIISNGGLWQITGDNSFGQTFGGPQMWWTNTGTLRKNGGSGNSGINSFNFVNQGPGVVDTQNGTLSFNGGPSNILGGSLTATAPGLLSIIGGTWTDAGGVATGSGTNRLAGGTLNLRTNIIPGLRHAGGEIFVIGPDSFQQGGAITNLTLDGSQLKGTNRVGSGALVVNSGGAEGQLTIQPGGLLTLATSSAKNLYALFLINQGTVGWSGGTLQGGSTPPTVISNGGLWQITGDNSFGQTFGGPTMQWSNAGTLQKSAGSGSSSINSFNFVNQSAGLIQADTGTLSLPSPITNSAGTLRLNGGTLQNGGTYAVTGGTLEGSGAFGANAITGGTLSPGQGGAGLIGFRAGLSLGAGATVSLAGTGTTPGTQYDQLSVTGAVSLANATLQIPALPTVAPGTTFMLIVNDSTDPVSGTFNGLPENALVPVGAQPFRIHYAGGSGNDVTLVRDSGSVTVGPLLSGGGFTGGTFQLLGSGSNGFIYTIQATTNFVNWTNLGFATGGVGGSFQFNDPNAFRFPYRFYRTTN